MAQSPYQPLNREDREIRLFDLFPGKDGDPITGRLRVVSLNRKPRFDCLSYVWGFDRNKPEVEELESHDRNFWKPATDILQKDYWSRVWIQQELVVSHEVRFHIRNVEITGRHLLRLRDNLVMSAVFANKTGADHPGNGIECGYTTFLSRISDRLVRAKRNKSNTPLIFLATKPIGLQASDPRDAIYGCLALANPSEINTLRVDYCLPLTQVYGDVIRNHLLYWKNLDFMSFRSRYSCAEYPTWLPMPERYISFEVCLRSEPLELDWLGIPASVSHDGLRLEVKACQLDTVTHISRKTAPGDAPIADDLQEILEYHHELHDDTIEGEVWASPSLSEILKWDMPLGFGLLPYEGVEKAIVDLLEVAKNDQHGELDWYAALTSMINSPTVNEKLSNALQSVLLSIRWHLPIATHHGRLGLVSCTNPEVTPLPTDQIWLVAGCSQPVVLREQGPGTGQFSLIGTALFAEFINADNTAVHDWFQDRISRGEALEDFTQRIDLV
ncbi:hypothetical protein PG988_015937 [Apiospora saccharicola]